VRRFVCPPDYAFEQLSYNHNRPSFQCEKAPLVKFLREQARQDQDKGMSKTHVLTLATHPEPTNKPIIGYFTLANASIPLYDLPHNARMSKHQEIPATLIARLARHQNYRKRGIGDILIHYAIDLCLQAPCAVILVDAKDEEAFKFYSRHKFQLLDQNKKARTRIQRVLGMFGLRRAIGYPARMFRTTASVRTE